ncbi:MAG: right-handed parallel beta-helix repeat-containing protein, partial [Phaeodactylibacter sp.]|nr:right-handed parallel beta-helix repeat-containing protein [Phaeodactylibacter sp.]
MDVQADNLSPVIGCEGQDEVNYTITLCNYCQPDTFNLEVVQNYPEDEILLTQGLDVTEGNDRFIRVSGIELGFDECFELNFTTKVVSRPGSNPIGTTVAIDSLENGNVVEDVAEAGLSFSPREVGDNTFLTVSGLFSESSLSSNGANCSSGAQQQNLHIDGTFEIDLSSTECFGIQNSLIILEPGASIDVSGGTFRLLNCRIMGCDGLWESITVEDGARLEMRGCTVSDAENAATLLDGSQADIHNNTFRNNYTGILMDLQAGQTASLFNCYGNTFVADGNLKAPRSDTKAFAGIWLRNASASVGVAGQAPNVFDGLYNGILALSSNLRVANSTFQNLLSGTGFSPRPGAGHGIHAFGGSPLGFNLLYVSGDEGRPVLFENCTVGLRASGTNAYIFNTRMEAVDIGLRLQGCQDRSLRLWKNDIQARDIGIALLQNNPRFCSVFDNTIRLSSTDQFQDPAGIVVEDTPFGAAGYNGYVIRENTAEVSVTGAGIRMGPSRQVQVHDNTILLLDEESEKTGIRLSGTADAWLRCNTVMGPAGPTYSKDTYGFDATGASGTRITCNTTSNTRLGFRFEGMGDGVKLQGNTIQDHFDGLLIEETGAIGVQEHHGNLWCGVYGGVGARHLASSPLIIQSSTFTIDANETISPGCELLPSWEANSQWFFDQDVEPG